MKNNFRLGSEKPVIILPYNPAIAEIVPHVRTIKRGNDLMLVPHRAAICKLLEHYDYSIPAPITFHYDWNNTTPFVSQKQTAAMLTMNYRGYVLSEMGVGKSRAALYAIDYLLREKAINKILIVAPLSTLSCVWEHEIFKVVPQYTSVSLYGTKAKRLQALGSDSDFYIINHDGVAVIADAIKHREDIDCILIDEMSAFKNARTKRWKVLNKITKRRKYVWGMSGGPIPNSVMDSYGQLKLITPDKVPAHERPFKNRLMSQVSTFKWVARDGATEEVFRLMQPSVRFTRAECYDLPPVTFSDREINLSTDQKKIYGTMLNSYFAQFQDNKITAANEGVKLGKLLQISCGYLYDNTRQKIVLPGDNRVDVLKEVIMEAGSKVIVLVPFVHALLAVVEALKDYVDVRYVYGETKKSERDEIFHNFQHKDSPHVLIAHPRTVSHGLTLTAASVIVWFSPTPSLETYDQACARITRFGQTRHAHIIHLVGTAVEANVYKRLKNKQTAQNTLLDLFREEGGVDPLAISA